jgi:hypothetical protein
MLPESGIFLACSNVFRDWLSLESIDIENLCNLYIYILSVEEI